MKELSIEDKAKRYDEALERCRKLYNGAKDRGETYEPERFETIFPELKESEDEKIRKHLIKHFGNKSKEDWNGVPVKSILAWLEKHGGHAKFINGIQVGDKVTRNEDGVLVNLSQLNRVAKKQGEQKPAWSEEDEAGLGDAMWAIEQARTIAKDENDMGNLWYAEHWLKSLKERCTWKPSEEQIEALLKLEEMHVLEHEKNQENAHLYMMVKSIREQLKKLREE